jgi:hypothetical protein
VALSRDAFLLGAPASSPGSFPSASFIRLRFFPTLASQVRGFLSQLVLEVQKIWIGDGRDAIVGQEEVARF